MPCPPGCPCRCHSSLRPTVSLDVHGHGSPERIREKFGLVEEIGDLVKFDIFFSKIETFKTNFNVQLKLGKTF